jgi:uncharacterized protein (TIGR03067 family)
MKKCAGMLLTIGFVMAAESPKEDTTTKDQERLQGTWKVVAIEVNGKKFAAKEIEKEIGEFKWVITADKITWTDAKKNEFLYKLDGSKEPKQIDLTFPERKTETTEGIYKLDGDNLKICIGKTARPTDFTAKADSRHYLYVLKREKK